MINEIACYITNNKCPSSIMVDESTSVSSKQTLIMYVKTIYEGEPCVYFLGLLQVASTASAELFAVIVNFLHGIGLSDTVLQGQLIGLCTDGASNMVGQFRGLATLFRQKYHLVTTFHCMAHRLELAIKNAVSDTSAISHFTDLVDRIYKVYSLSPKNQTEIQLIAENLSVELLKVKKIFDLRWIFSSFVSLSALWRNLPALVQHFDVCSCDQNKSSKERSKFTGLKGKLQSWLILSQMALLKDCSRCLKELSLYFQRDSASVIDMNIHLTAAKEKILGFKHKNGKTLSRFVESFQSDQTFKGFQVKKNETDEQAFIRQREKFCQALHDNLNERFPSSELLTSALVLSQDNLPEDSLDRALYGDKKIVYLCKTVGFTKEKITLILEDYTVWKKTNSIRENLQSLYQVLSCLIISTAACERGFSAMNLVHNKLRNKLDTSTVADVLMLKLNGPTIAAWKPRKYVISWLQKGQHGAKDKVTGKPTEARLTPRHSQLFLSESQ